MDRNNIALQNLDRDLDQEEIQQDITEITENRTYRKFEENLAAYFFATIVVIFALIVVYFAGFEKCKNDQLAGN